MEQWKKYGRYEISNFGRVRSVDTIRSTIVKLHSDKKGYLRYTFYENGKSKTIRVHILVWDLFGNKLRDGMTIDHIDEDKSNNRIDNLQLLTSRDNFYKTRKSKRLRYSSNHVGVCWLKRDEKWNARKVIKGKFKSLGNFDTEYEAHVAYEKQ